jgi:Zn-dependent protease with chaperone function
MAEPELAETVIMNTIPSASETVTVERWPTEMPLLVFCAGVSLALWFLLTITIIGLIYALMLGAFFFVAHAVFVAHVKGNAVRVGPEQFPELHAAVERLSRRVGLARPPVAYVMESGGALNALATKFMRSNIIVLFSDLLDACGEDERARDMIIAHELGHIRCGHLRWHWFLLPSMIVPFLGTALSRAREFTCDRYGLQGCGDRDGALHGLTILAAGPKMGRLVNRRALVRQSEDLNTGWMTIGRWMSTHPPLAHRVAALDPSLQNDWVVSAAGPVRAVAIMGGIPMAVTAVIVAFIFAGAQMIGLDNLLSPDLAAAMSDDRDLSTLAPETAALMTQQAEQDLNRLATAAVSEQRTKGLYPEDLEALVAACGAACEDGTTDPFDGQDYGYSNLETHFILFSSGPDGSARTDDDLVYDSRVGQILRGWDNSPGQ